MGVPVVRIPNAVAGIDPQPKEQVVLFAGNVTRRKGVDVLLEAWRNLDPPGWRLVLAGPTPERDLLAHPPDRTEFVGSLPRGELHALLGRAAVAVLPSRREAMPLFVLEAMSAGAAAVSTRVGAIPDVLEGVGELVPPEDAPALGAALNRIITSDQHRATLAAAARKRYRDRYSPEAVIPALDEVFLAALAEPRRITRRNRGGDTTDSTRRSASRR